jgi:hypothetical protein
MRNRMRLIVVLLAFLARPCSVRAESIWTEPVQLRGLHGSYNSLIISPSGVHGP